jgi:hypothetical protein
MSLLVIGEFIMATYIRDASLKVIASIVESGDGMLIYNTHGGLLGSYKQSINKTFDAHQCFVGDGNLLIMLIGR